MPMNIKSNLMIFLILLCKSQGFFVHPHFGQLPCTQKTTKWSDNAKSMKKHFPNGTGKEQMTGKKNQFDLHNAKSLTFAGNICHALNRACKCIFTIPDSLNPGGVQSKKTTLYQ